MTPRQRQLVLLIGIMGLLMGIFAFMIAQSPDTIDVNPDNTLNISNISLPYPINDSVNGLQQITEDLGSSLLFASGDGS